MFTLEETRAESRNVGWIVININCLAIICILKLHYYMGHA